MSVGTKITVEQAEACMRADEKFVVRVGLHGVDTYRYGDGMMLLTGLHRDERSQYKTIASRFDYAPNSEPHIAADPNGTFERLYGTLTFEQAWAALGRGETVLGRQGGIDDDCFFLFRFECKDGAGPRIVYGNSNRFGEKEKEGWTDRFGGFSDVAFVSPVEREDPKPKTPEERIAELEARVAELEASK